MRKLFTILTLISLSAICLKAQVNMGGKPYSFNGKYISAKIPVVVMPEVNGDSLIAYDAIENRKGSGPWIFGYNHFTNINPSNAGLWETLVNGDKLWRVAIECPKALSINLTFDKYVLPKGAKLYIYNEEKTYVLGAFTAENNQDSKELGVDLVPGSKTIVEYYEPANVTSHGELSIYRVTHGYKDLFNWAKNFGTSGSCEYNVNCTPIGTGWTKQRDAVAIIVVGGSGACTGAMVDDVPHSNTPYFLTANHCGTTGVSTWVFRWNWQAAGCPNPASSPSTAQSTTGSVLRATNASSDFTLLQLNSTPPLSYNVFYAGWDNSGVAPSRGMGIHHPDGDIKKISSSAVPFINATWAGTPTNSHWQVTWQADSGVTEPGSSGSPIFDQNQRIVGQLHGGPSYCGALIADKNDLYGKFSISWTGNGATTSSARLKDWLDPANTGLATTNGHYYGAVTAGDSLDLKVDSISEPIGSYCNDSSYVPIVKVSNQGTNTITSFSLKYRMDAGAWSNYNWTGSIATGAVTSITLPTLNTTSGNHVFTVATSSPNGHADQNNSNDTLKNSFKVRKGGPVTFRLFTDTYPGEVSLAIYNPIGSDTFLVINAGDLTIANHLYTYSLCMADICYRIKLYDSGSDGICCGFGNGYYVMLNGADTILPNASYTISITKDFCNYQLPNMNINASDINICPGDIITLTAIESDATTRNWSINGPGLSQTETVASFNVTLNNPGNYDVVLRGYNSYGADSTSIIITVNDNPTATYTVVNATTANNGSITVATATGALPISHHWSNGLTGNMITNLTPGTYYDTIIDNNSCTFITSNVVQNAIGINSLTNNNELFVYPNPFVNEITVYLNNVSQAKEIRLSNAIGESVAFKTEVIDANTIKIITHSLAKGVYYLEVKNNDKTYTSKLLK